MKTIKAVLVGMSLTGLSIVGIAQEEAPPERYTYATYYSCPGGPNSRADEIIANDAARMDALVKDGTILAWGWLTHHTGGAWQRVFYFQSDSLDGLLDGSDAVQATEDDAEDEADEGLTFGQICNRHEDYIWQFEAGMTGKARGPAGFSVYLLCDSSREDRADEIVKKHVAPILDKMVNDRKLTSWGWQSHVLGGEYRKLQTMTASDPKALLKARTEAIEAIYGDGNSAGVELDDICGAHVDYMWDIVHETP